VFGNHPKNRKSLKGFFSRVMSIGAVLFFGMLMWACNDETTVTYQPMGTPQNVEATQVDDVIEVTWDPVAISGYYNRYAPEYKVYVKKDDVYAGTFTVTEARFEFEPDGDGEYSFQVETSEVDEYSTSQKSTAVVCQYMDPYLLRVPTGLTAKQVEDSIKVSWNPVGVAQGYILYVYNDKGYRKEIDSKSRGHIFYNLTVGAKYTFQIRAYSKNEFSDWSESVSCTFSKYTGGTTSGLYMGIIGFNDDVRNEKSIDILTNYKDINNTSVFTSFVNKMTTKPATCLYYAVDNAISRLENSALPSDLVNVSIITFTDGMDNASISLNNDYKKANDYRDAIKKRIAETKIKGLSIDAYAIGLKGQDVSDVDAFRTALESMASKNDNAFTMDGMDDVNKTFLDIAKSLYRESEETTLELVIPGGIDDGTKIRFTFDYISDANQSDSYIEGIFKRDGTSILLQNVVYHKVKSGNSTLLRGSVSGPYVTFAFRNITTDTSNALDTRYCKHWNYNANISKWEKNSEFTPDKDVQSIVKRKSAVIMLVLDCTTSLGNNDFSMMKSAATNFIKVFTNK